MQLEHIVSVAKQAEYSDVLDSEVAECDFTDVYIELASDGGLR